MQKQTHKKQMFWYVTGILFFAVTLLIIYIGNDCVPFMMDDDWYSTRLFDEEPVRNLADIIAAQTWHFFNWGGRCIAHGLLQLTLMAGWFWADIINVIFNILLAMLICKAAKVKGIVYYAMVWGMLYGLNANWRQSLCWQSGAANYLFMTTFALFFLWCYVRELEGQRKSLLGISLWMWPLGLAAGWSNENMGPTIWLLSLGIILYLWVKERRWHWWMLFGNITSLIGTCMVILAPGNFVRAEQTITDKGLLWRVFLRCYSESKALLEFLSPTLIVLAFALCIGMGICKIRLSKANVIYLAGALLSWGAMILSPHYPDRATFGTMVFLICVIVSMAGETLKQRPDLKPWLCAAGGVIWLRGMFFMAEYIGVSWGWIK